MPTRSRHSYLFPWRGGNHFELLVDGQRFFPRMFEAVEWARRHILLEIYLFDSGGMHMHILGRVGVCARRSHGNLVWVAPE